MKTPVVLLLLLLPLAAPLPAQRGGGSPPEVIELWPEGVPGSLGDAEEDHPTLGIYLPDADKAVGTAVVVCPGGGYRNLAMDHEGDQIARWLNSIGVAAFVLKYRLGPKYHHPAQQNDVLRAIRTVRKRAWHYGVAEDRIGVMGFSAGGHLASTAATMFEEGNPEASDPWMKISSRPDFAVLCYPVISFVAPFTHEGSRRNLLGDNPERALVEMMSTELRVTRRTPPTFLWHTSEDTAVPVQNSIAFYLRLRENDVPAEMHIFEKGRHGMGLGWTDRALSEWPGLLANWLQVRGLLRR
ncbi:MAG: alpha/beta hydrolase fold domain-containing protein [Acidobacteria bacterium]|nr:alpha/beta hydrolase fold domain-containing protein [Acidobacteriota bacterium]